MWKGQPLSTIDESEIRQSEVSVSSCIQSCLILIHPAILWHYISNSLKICRGFICLDLLDCGRLKLKDKNKQRETLFRYKLGDNLIWYTYCILAVWLYISIMMYCIMMIKHEITVSLMVWYGKDIDITNIFPGPIYHLIYDANGWNQ